jgi:hypothetical protein
MTGGHWQWCDFRVANGTEATESIEDLAAQGANESYRLNGSLADDFGAGKELGTGQ